jgi:DNA-binding transcriptional regulator GbsR (MarR family)
MTGKTDFSPEEWEVVLKGPPSAGMIVITAQRGGTFRESFSMAKAYSEARKQHGDSELLDEIASTKPEMDHTRYHSPEELKDGSLKHITDAVALLKEKATPEELDEYKKFIVALANRVADARKEGFLGLSGERVSDDERSAIAEIESALAA